jgi:hypothetical protein
VPSCPPEFGWLCGGFVAVGGVSSVASDNAVGALLTAPRNGFPEGAAAA